MIKNMLNGLEIKKPKTLEIYQLMQVQMPFRDQFLRLSNMFVHCCLQNTEYANLMLEYNKGNPLRFM